jgi:predicted nucleotide-binding protein
VPRLVTEPCLAVRFIVQLRLAVVASISGPIVDGPARDAAHRAAQAPEPTNETRGRPPGGTPSAAAHAKDVVARMPQTCLMGGRRVAKKNATTSSQEGSLPQLTLPRSEAENQIAAQIDTGRQLFERPIASGTQLKQAQAEYSTWDEYNVVLLRRLFDSRELAQRYLGGVALDFGRQRPLPQEIESFRSDVQRKIRSLESIKQQLPLYEPGPAPSVPLKATRRAGNVFLVHGHDEAAKESVARFLEQIGLDTVVLHEKPSAGRTIIEKFEDYSAVGYAVVILTPDDTCSAGEGKPSVRRPRQNVIFELGFFVGKLGRERVCALYKQDTEIPSDYQGVLYVPMDESGGWRLEVAREMKHAGMEVDLNKAL